MCAEGCDATDESNAKPLLLQDYIEAAYLLPCILETGHMFKEAALDLTFDPVIILYEATGCLRLFHDAMLPPHPLHTRLTSCACLLRVWAVELTESRVKREDDERSLPFCTWVSQSGVVTSICACLKPGLEVSLLEGA